MERNYGKFNSLLSPEVRDLIDDVGKYLSSREDGLASRHELKKAMDIGDTDLGRNDLWNQAILYMLDSQIPVQRGSAAINSVGLKERVESHLREGALRGSTSAL